METTNDQAEAVEQPQPDNLYTLQHPVHFGSERIETLELKPTSRAMRDFKIKIGLDQSIEFEPVRFAELGLTFAGKPRAIVEKMHPADVTGLGMLVMAFILPGPTTGKGV